MTFPGGGSMGVGKGQITDDSEMAMCILLGLTSNMRQSKELKFNENNELDGEA